MYNIKFPIGFRDSRRGAYIDNDNIDKWIELGINELEKSGEDDYFIRSGDSIVIVYRMAEEDGGGYEVIVSNHYYEGHIGNKFYDEEE